MSEKQNRELAVLPGRTHALFSAFRFLTGWGASKRDHKRKSLPFWIHFFFFTHRIIPSPPRDKARGKGGGSKF